MVRTALVNKNELKKGAWTKDEDEMLRAYVSRYGHWNWRQLPKFAGLSRCGKSCRLRWMNYLRPDVKRGNFSREEEDSIVKLHEELGNKWSKIAAKLPGRTDNDIKNHWHTHLKKRRKKTQEASFEEKSDNISHSSISQKSISEPECIPDDFTPCQQIALESFTAPQEATSSLFCDFNSYDLACSSGPNYITEYSSMVSLVDEESSGDFWTRPFIGDSAYNQDGQCSFPLTTEAIRYDLSYASYEDNSIDVLYQMM